MARAALLALQKQVQEQLPPPPEQPRDPAARRSQPEPSKVSEPGPRPVATPVRSAMPSQDCSTDAQPTEQHAWDAEFAHAHTEETLVDDTVRVASETASAPPGPSDHHYHEDDDDDDSVLIGDIDPATSLHWASVSITLCM